MPDQDGMQLTLNLHGAEKQYTNYSDSRKKSAYIIIGKIRLEGILGGCLKTGSNHIVQDFIQPRLKISYNETAQISLGNLFHCLSILMVKKFVFIFSRSLF